MKDIIKIVEEKTKIKRHQIEAVLKLLDEGSTIPFIARYRKEVTSNLNEEEIRAIVLIYDYEKKLDKRKDEVKRLIEEKDKLTDELIIKIDSANILSEVEDIYLPYKEKRKTRATEAISKGLEPLADVLISDESLDLVYEASKYLNEKVSDVDEAIQGAKDIIAEKFSEDVEIRKELRNNMKNYGYVETSLKKNAADEKKIFELYYEKSEPVKYIVPHRILAINRGENENILKVKININDDIFLDNSYKKLVKNISYNKNKEIIKEAINDGYKRLLFPSIEREVRSELTEKAHEQAINVFALNLEQLLLTPPLKNRIILGFDPAFRTGCKLGVIDNNGDFLYKDVIYPHEKKLGEEVDLIRREQSATKLAHIVKKFDVKLIAIGNGTASRESEEFVADTIRRHNLDCSYIIVSEAGASVYSASKEAIKEFPDLHVEERSAISIARRVLDPLSELINIDPKSIGVGQYQHDVNQKKLEETLNFVISKVVNSVGVNLNTASISLLSYVSGLNKTSASNIISYRSKHGFIKNREELKKVKGIGDNTYDQAVGFLKIYNSDETLDKTFIHPENYSKVKKILKDLNLDETKIGEVILENAFENIKLSELSKNYGIGEYTLNDIVEELKKPLRDIRDNYPTPILKSDVLHLEDLSVGMKLEGIVRSVVDFGAFIDIGLKNDGLVHKSKLSKQRINHPLDILSVGDIVEVYVINIDVDKKRVSLSMFNE